MIIQAELKCKQTGCEADPCAVDKVIELPSPRFRLFSRALLADYDFIAENKNAIRHDEDARHLIFDFYGEEAPCRQEDHEPRPEQGMTFGGM